MATVVEQELNHLRRGRGALGTSVAQRIGPALREICGIVEQDDPSAMGRKLTLRLTETATRLPEDLRIVAMVGLGLHPDADQRFLDDRLEWLAQRWKCGERTVVRRLNEAIHHLAQELVREEQRGLPKADPDGWYVESFKALLRMDVDPPEALEDRIAVATVDGLTELATSISVPRHPDDKSETHQIDVELVYGGRLELREQPYETYFRNVIALPAPLNIGEQHKYAMRVRLPGGQPMAPHYVHVPLRRSDHFELRIRFDPARLPRMVWRLTEVATAVIYEDKPTSDILEPDCFGEIQCEFRNLRQGFGYGLRWDPG